MLSFGGRTKSCFIYGYSLDEDILAAEIIHRNVCRTITAVAKLKQRKKKISSFAYSLGECRDACRRLYECRRKKSQILKV